MRKLFLSVCLFSNLSVYSQINEEAIRNLSNKYFENLQAYSGKKLKSQKIDFLINLTSMHSDGARTQTYCDLPTDLTTEELGSYLNSLDENFPKGLNMKFEIKDLENCINTNEGIKFTNVIVEKTIKNKKFEILLAIDISSNEYKINKVVLSQEFYTNFPQNCYSPKKKPTSDYSYLENSANFYYSDSIFEEALRVYSLIPQTHQSNEIKNRIIYCQNKINISKYYFNSYKSFLQKNNLKEAGKYLDSSFAKSEISNLEYTNSLNALKDIENKKIAEENKTIGDKLFNRGLLFSALPYYEKAKSSIPDDFQLNENYAICKAKNIDTIKHIIISHINKINKKPRKKALKIDLAKILLEYENFVQLNALNYEWLAYTFAGEEIRISFNLTMSESIEMAKIYCVKSMIQGNNSDSINRLWKEILGQGNY